jgi:uncharacterized protein (TIGR00369 family)
MPPLLNAAELESIFYRGFPGSTAGSMVVEELGDDTIRMRMKVSEGNLRPGATLSGPTLFTLADTVAWLLTVAHLGPGRDAVTSSVTVNYLRRPQLADLLGEGRLLKLGRRLSVVDVLIYSEGSPDPVVQAAVTYAPV